MTGNDFYGTIFFRLMLIAMVGAILLFMKRRLVEVLSSRVGRGAELLSWLAILVIGLMIWAALELIFA